MKNLKDEEGQAIILVAVFMGLLMMGFLAMALDVGYLFAQKKDGAIGG